MGLVFCGWRKVVMSIILHMAFFFFFYDGLFTQKGCIGR